ISCRNHIPALCTGNKRIGCQTSVRHEPFAGNSCSGILPQQVSSTVTVEIASGGHVPTLCAGNKRIGTDATVTRHPSFAGLPGRVLPQKVLSTVIVEIAGRY